MYYLSRSIRALFRKEQNLPTLEGEAFVFGAAPNPAIPKELLSKASIVTANASQIFLERYGVTKPHITCMRTDMAEGRDVDVMKLESLRDRQTGLLVLIAGRKDPKCEAQLALLAKVNYRFEEVQVLHRVDRCVIHNRLLDSRKPFLLKRFDPSMGLEAILLCLAMGARRVATAGISFRSDGCSFSDLDYKRIHVEADLEIFRRICRLGLPVYAVDEDLAFDSGLQRWPPSRGGQVTQTCIQHT
ncbi:MAG: hypothetical protein ACC631_06475 [Halocynthiibacter sp.]